MPTSSISPEAHSPSDERRDSRAPVDGVAGASPVVEEIREGQPPLVSRDSLITVRLTGRIAGEEPFQEINEPAGPWPVAGLIDGLAMGLEGAGEGAIRRITIPPTLGYGNVEVPVGDSTRAIPPGSTLVYEVEVLRVVQPSASEEVSP